MGTIRKPSDSGSGGTEATDFIQWVDGREPQIHELWCLGLDRIIRGVHPSAGVEVATRTIGESVTNYLAENGRRIKIFRQLSVNDSVQNLGFPDQAQGSVFPFICHLMVCVEFTGW